MISLEPVFDADVIKKALAVDDLFEQLVIETPFEQWRPDLSTNAFFFAFRDGSPFGVLIVERFCSNALIYHGAVFKLARNKGTSSAIRDLMKELKNISGGKTIMTSIPVSNEITIGLCKKAGMIEKCVIPNASLKGDIMILSE